MKKPIWVVIPSAGQGRRFGSPIPKQYLNLLGRTVLEQTLARFLCRSDLAGIVVAVSGDDVARARTDLPEKVFVVEGGVDRTASVFNALSFLKSLAGEDDLVAVHDAARPCIRQSSLDYLFSIASANPDGALLAQLATDTIKWADNDSHVSETLDRSRIWLAQTPQIFPFHLLYQALLEVRSRALVITDESSAVEALGKKPSLVNGPRDNIKITMPEDLLLAAYFLQKILEEND